MGSKSKIVIVSFATLLLVIVAKAEPSLHTNQVMDSPIPPTHLSPNIEAPLAPFNYVPRTSGHRVATRLLWPGATCSGQTFQTYGVGLGPAGTCVKDSYGESHLTMCSNATGLVEYTWPNPTCEGSWSHVEVTAIRRCKFDGATYTEVCGDEFVQALPNPTLPVPISGDGTIGSNYGCNGGICPPGIPFYASYNTPDCTGTNSTYEIHHNMKLNKCYLFYTETMHINIQATCDNKYLTINEFGSGCAADQAPLMSRVYLTNVCIKSSDGTSELVSCGNPEH